MRKMTPMILVILMLASVLSNIDVAELQEMNEYEETSGRASSDAEVVAITSPRETSTMPNGEKADELLAGVAVNFRAYIKNSGDAALEDLQYHVAVYNSQNGNRGDIAQDNNGNDLQWTNGQVICMVGCSQQSLAAGAFLNGGETTLVDSSGNAFEWMPNTGNYFVVVSVTSAEQGDPGNDEVSIAVSVKEYYDVIVDLTWVDSNGDDIDGNIQATDATDFRITVELDAPSSPLMNIRNASVAISVSGATSNAPASATLGSSMTVETYNDFDSGQTDSDTRLVIGDDGDPLTNGTYTGTATYTLTPPADGAFSVEVELTDYTVYESGNCASITATCEVAKTGSDDEFQGNNIAEIGGSSSTFHDIVLGEFQIWKELGDDSEDSLAIYGGLGLDISSSLSPGTYLLYAEGLYASSSSSLLYEWQTNFTITDMSDNTQAVFVANECDVDEGYTHAVLGIATDKTPDASPNAVACTEITLGEGEFNIEADFLMIGAYDENDGSIDVKIGDMANSNNRYDYLVDVVNYAPQILSVETTAKEGTELIAGTSNNQFTATVTAFDVEGGELLYNWARNSDGQPIEGCDGNTCTVTVDASMVPTFRFFVSVTDEYGLGDYVDVEVSVWNSATATSSGLANGVTAVYDLVYKGSSLDVTFADGDTTTELTLPGCDGTYAPAAAVVMSPSTTYDTKDISTQTIMVHFPNTVSATEMWLNVGTTYMQVASGTPEEIDATTSGYTYNIAAGSDMIIDGTTLYLLTEECATLAAPDNTVTGFTATAAKAGGITMNWQVSALLSDERVVLTLTDSAGTEVAELEYLDGTFSTTYAGTNTMHGETYAISAAVCNGVGCSTAATASVTADKEVAAVTAENFKIDEVGETWVLDWDASSDDADVASWLVCYMKSSFTAEDMAQLVGTDACVATDDTGATINKYTQAGVFNVYFTAVPVDVVGNIATAGSIDYIEYSRDADNTNPGDGSTTTDSEASSGVPTWTWGVIGVVVVAAFIVGAFILSRGDGEEGDDKEWDY